MKRMGMIEGLEDENEHEGGYEMNETNNGDGK